MSDLQLESAMQKAFGVTGEKYRKVAVVSGTAINVKEHVCDVSREGEATLLDVRLHAVADEIASSVVVRPKEGSQVVCAFIQDQEPEALVLQCSEIEEVLVKVGEMEYRINGEGHRIAGAGKTLKNALELLIEAVQQIIVLQGRNPDQVKLAQSLSIIQTILQ